MSDSHRTITAETVIQRPVGVVRQHFLDIDHLARNKVFSRVKVRWVQGLATGKRRFLRESRIMGRAVVDMFTLLDHDDGSIERQCEDGPNKGTVITARFASTDTQSTHVTLDATVPVSGLRQAMGPLFDMAVRKGLEQELSERKADLEGRGYEPHRARGHIDAAVHLLDPLVARLNTIERGADRVLLLTPLLEAVCITAIADNEADDAERDTIRAIVRALKVPALEDNAVDAMIVSFVDGVRAEGMNARCKETGEALRRAGISLEGLTASALVAQVSHGVDAAELAVLQQLAEHAGHDESELHALLERVDAALAG